MSAQDICIAGVDEAGRGPLAGPVVVAAVVLRKGQSIVGVRDSKKLTAAKREALVGDIQSQAIAWTLASASVEEIDELNILHATMLAMRRAIEKLNSPMQVIHIDGNRCPELPERLATITRALVGGDDICPAIGAASILAKVHRDRTMLELHARYPEYGFDRHKGYPTALHMQALREYGVTPLHRMSFRPVREAAAAQLERRCAG